LRWNEGLWGANAVDTQHEQGGKAPILPAATALSGQVTRPISAREKSACQWEAAQNTPSARQMVKAHFPHVWNCILFLNIPIISLF
jgi:hypothetical protein